MSFDKLQEFHKRDGFVPGDRVVQIHGSMLREYNLPSHIFPCLTVTSNSSRGLSFKEIEGSSIYQQDGYDPKRFALCKGIQDQLFTAMCANPDAYFPGAIATNKDTNPKDSVGIRKAPISTVSGPVMAELGVAMLEGARKYGRHNYRVAGVRYSVYHDAAWRHLIQSWEGEDIDPDSGIAHVTKAIATLVVLRDAMIQGKLVDDRPPKSPDGWLRNLQPAIDELFNKYPDAKEAYTNEKRPRT